MRSQTQREIIVAMVAQVDRVGTVILMEMVTVMVTARIMVIKVLRCLERHPSGQAHI